MLCGNEDIAGYVQEGEYRKYLLEKLEKIVNYFYAIRCQNLRIIVAWIEVYRKIYDVTKKYFDGSKYYETIMDEFCQYSIWSISAQRNNKKICDSAYHGNQEMVYYEGHPYLHIFRHGFIDMWIKKDVWEDVHLVRAVRKIEERCDREKQNEKVRRQSSGEAYQKLRGWRYLKDEEIKDLIIDMTKELGDNKYIYHDYSNIVGILIFFKDMGLYDGNLYEIQNMMLSLIMKDNECQEENPFPQSFESEELKQKYLEIFNPISEKRKIRNKELDKEKIEEEDIYETAKQFLEQCSKREMFYCNQKTFTEYIDIDKFIDLVNKSDLEGIYQIQEAFSKVYYMGNVRDFYENDAEALISISKKLLDSSIVKREGITRWCAIKNLVMTLNQILKRLGVPEIQIGECE